MALAPMPPPDPPRQWLAERLRVALGIAVSVSDLELSWREWRWLALLPAHVVFVAPDAAGWRRLEVEASLLARLCGLGPWIPRVLARDEDARMQVRARIDGVGGHAIEAMVFGADARLRAVQRYANDCPITAAGERLAGELGAALAGVHGSISAEQGCALGLPANIEAVDFDAVALTLREHVGVPLLLAALDHARRWVAALRPDLAVTHGDPNMHNVLADPATGALLGLIDFGDANVAHRWEDLRYLHSNGVPFVRRALRAYAEVAGVSVDEREIGRYHVVSAFHQFMFVPPDAPRFPEIIAWTTSAVRHLAPDWMT
jgi:hypothetical protein